MERFKAEALVTDLMNDMARIESKICKPLIKYVNPSDMVNNSLPCKSHDDVTEALFNYLYKVIPSDSMAAFDEYLGKERNHVVVEEHIVMQPDLFVMYSHDDGETYEFIMDADTHKPKVFKEPKLAEDMAKLVNASKVLLVGVFKDVSK